MFGSPSTRNAVRGRHAPFLSVGVDATMVAGVLAVISANVAPLQPMFGFTGIQDPQLVLGGPDGHRGMLSIQTYATGQESSVTLFSARGTALAPSALQNGDFLAEFFGHGRDGVKFNYSGGGGMIVAATENYTTSAAGSQIILYATPAGSATVQGVASFNTSGMAIGSSSPPSGTQRSIGVFGAAAGSNAGSNIIGNDGGSVAWGVGSYTSILGGTYANQMLFYSSSGFYVFRPGSSITPTNNGDMTMQLTSNTSLTFKVKGSDGTVRSNSLTLS